MRKTVCGRISVGSADSALRRGGLSLAVLSSVVVGFETNMGAE